MVLKSWRGRFHFPTFPLLLHAASWVPLIFMLVDYLQGKIDLYNAPLLEERIGRYALVFLLATLSCTPLYRIFHLEIARIARIILGRYTFLYALFHFCTFLILDYAFNLRQIAEAYRQTPYLIFGSIGMVILTALMITSNNKARSVLKRNWKRLHQFLYLAGILVIIHSFLAVKADFRFPIITAVIMGLLLLLRIPFVQNQLYH